MFGGLFVGYFIYRAAFPEMYTVGGDSLDWRLGALNTVVLLISSFTMAQAVTDTMEGNNKKALLKEVAPCYFLKYKSTLNPSSKLLSVLFEHPSGLQQW